MKFQVLQELQTANLSQFQEAVRTLSQSFSKRSVVALKGPLGAGKTEFVKSLALTYGIQGVSSPTFALHHRYSHANLSIEHLDLYRMKQEEELESTGFWDFFLEREALILIEWPERMNLSQIPLDWDLFQVVIRPDGEKRELILSRRI